jgi:hypothetical protein
MKVDSIVVTCFHPPKEFTTTARWSHVYLPMTTTYHQLYYIYDLCVWVDVTHLVVNDHAHQ